MLFLTLALSSVSTYGEEIDCHVGDMFCQMHVATDSYCKYYADVQECANSGLPCSCDMTMEEVDCTGADSYCVSANGGQESYCKYWMKSPACSVGDQPCNCFMQAPSEMPATETPTSPPTPISPVATQEPIVQPQEPLPDIPVIDCSRGDSECRMLNMDRSALDAPVVYCKYWASTPVCSVGDQPCSCDLDEITTSPPATTSTEAPTTRSRRCRSSTTQAPEDLDTEEDLKDEEELADDGPTKDPAAAHTLVPFFAIIPALLTLTSF